MHLSIFYMALVTGIVQSTSAFESQTVAGHPCIKRNRQIYCPFPGSKLSPIYKASNSSIQLGPIMYYKRFTTERPQFATPTSTSTTTAQPTVVRSATHVIYYTKQYDDRNGQNAFDLNDDDEYRFMHQPSVEENVIDDGSTVRNVKRRRIDMFIEENKALIRRMFGTHRSAEDDWMFADNFHDHYSSFHEESNQKRRRPKRSIKPTPLSGNKIDSCESSVEIVTPYWASNSAGKIRAIVNTQHLQQAIQQEVCQAVQTKRCHKDCTCEQKYKWHRLLSYDPDDDCKGIFMDWFLFPSCCVCRCTRL